MELEDATCLPLLPSGVENAVPDGRLEDAFIGSTIALELKPKQGFLQDHGIGVEHCQNCILQVKRPLFFQHELQLEKCKGEYWKMYDFCPMDLYSGDYKRMTKAVLALLANPMEYVLGAS